MLFAGLTDVDFDAYLPARASSNVFTRPRLEVKHKLTTLAKGLQSFAAAQGLALELRASDERPSIWNKHAVTAQSVYLWRDAEARRHLASVLDHGRDLAAALSDPTPFYQHAFLAVRLDATGIEVTLEVHGDAVVDLRNLRARLAEPLRRGELLQALWAAKGAAVGVTEGPRFDATQLDGVRLAATLDALTAPSQWWFARTLRVERAEAIARAASLGEDLARAFAALVPIYRLVAWSAENDLVRVEAEIARVEADRVTQEREAAAREHAWREQHEAEILRARGVAEARSLERAAAQEKARPAMVQNAVQGLLRREAPVREENSPKPRREERASPPRREERASPPTSASPVVTPRPAPAPSAPVLAVGARVKVTAGPFAGRAGTIIDLDSRGFVKVNFGLLSARVELGEIDLSAPK